MDLLQTSHDTEAGLVQAVREHPGDQAYTSVLADFWQEQGLVSPVRLHHVPNWLRLCWYRLAPKEFRSGYGPSAYGTVTNMRAMFEYNLGDIDHWGSTLIAGCTCFVSEPYRSAANCQKLFQPLTDLLHCAWAWSELSYHMSGGPSCGPNYGCRRVLLLPPLEMPLPRARKKR